MNRKSSCEYATHFLLFSLSSLETCFYPSPFWLFRFDFNFSASLLFSKTIETKLARQAINARRNHKKKEEYNFFNKKLHISSQAHFFYHRQQQNQNS
jgi:hypothetical protein